MPSILVVDDEPLARDALVRLFAREGFSAFAADAAAPGLAALGAAARFDVVLLDYRMPGLDGLAVLRRLRANPRHAGVRIVVYTAETKTDVHEAALAAGADAVVTKPATFTELLAAVRAGSRPGAR